MAIDARSIREMLAKVLQRKRAFPTVGEWLGDPHLKDTPSHSADAFGTISVECCERSGGELSRAPRCERSS
jgi:hypothetical protein